jgi:hypothetical protein
MVIVPYDLAVWQGDRSADDAAADEEYGHLHARYIRSAPGFAVPVSANS